MPHALSIMEGTPTTSKKDKGVKFSVEQAMKAQRGSRGIALLFL
jgi:hypothetical protein